MDASVGVVSEFKANNIGKDQNIAWVWEKKKQNNERQGCVFLSKYLECSLSWMNPKKSRYFFYSLLYYAYFLI